MLKFTSSTTQFSETSLLPFAGVIGLALSYALSTTSLLGNLLCTFTDTEKELVSVERADEYIRGLEKEESDEERRQAQNVAVSTSKCGLQS